jgi:hypothetical protein
MPTTTIAQSAASLLKNHVTLEVEGIDRMYLNAYVPLLQTEGGVATFFRHLGYSFPSSALMAPIRDAFVKAIESYAKSNGVEVVSFDKGQRKDDVTKEHLKKWSGKEGVLYIGKAQEKTRVFRTTKRRNAQTGQSYAWLMRSSAMVNHYYFYVFDDDFGPFFLKFGTYFPCTAKLCINGHEYVKRQLEKEGIAYEPLDNGILSCDDPVRLQQICDELSAGKIEALFRKWLAKLPHPFTDAHRNAGGCYELSIWQAEFSLTQVLERPVHGRIFFEEMIRENLDIGRPSHVQLIFDRRVTKRTPGRFRTRVITEGVTPSLHIDYKGCHVKQYHKEGKALRTETTINNPRDFGIGKALVNLPKLRQIGFAANRRLLDVQKLTHNAFLGEDEFNKIDKPIVVENQRISALRFGDPRTQALLSAASMFLHLPAGFSLGNLREHLAPLLGISPNDLTQSRMSYDLRRLRLHGIIERIKGKHRYRLTNFGMRAGIFLTRVYNRVLRPGLSKVATAWAAEVPSPTTVKELQRTVDRHVCAANIAV